MICSPRANFASAILAISLVLGWVTAAVSAHLPQRQEETQNALNTLRHSPGFCWIEEVRSSFSGDWYEYASGAPDPNADAPKPSGDLLGYLTMESGLHGYKTYREDEDEYIEEVNKETGASEGTRWRRVPCPEPTNAATPPAPEITVSIGGVSSGTSWTNQQDISFFTVDPSNPAHTIPLSSGGSGGFGIYIPWEQAQAMFGPAATGSGSAGTAVSRYAPEDKPASGFPAVLPTKAPPKTSPPPPRITFALDGNVYFFAGPNATINGIPGGPGITPTGNDSFNFKDKVLFTAGGVVNVPINATWTASLTGGFAEADMRATYNCGTYCTTGAVPPFSASKEVWLPGGYVGGRLTVPLALSPWRGTTIGFDYKHVMLASETVALGNPATRQVTQNVSQNIDLFMVRLAISFGMPH